MTVRSDITLADCIAYLESMGLMNDIENDGDAINVNGLTIQNDGEWPVQIAVFTKR